jgi:hypothetical protein
MKYQSEKLKALVHYVIWRAGDRVGFGATKLNKVLWFSDASAYRLRRESITGVSYIRREFCPTPKQIMMVISALEAEGTITVHEERYYNKRINAFARRSSRTRRPCYPKNVEMWIGGSGISTKITPLTP